MITASVRVFQARQGQQLGLLLIDLFAFGLILRQSLV